MILLVAALERSELRDLLAVSAAKSQLFWQQSSGRPRIFPCQKSRRQEMKAVTAECFTAADERGNPVERACHALHVKTTRGGRNA